MNIYTVLKEGRMDYFDLSFLYSLSAMSLSIETVSHYND